MFSWFKNKHNNLIPDDAEKGLMTSNFCNIKIGTALSIPSNLTCFINYNDKNYASLEAGSYDLDKNILSSIYAKQSRGKKELKKIKIDLYFVNKNTFPVQFTYHDNIPVKKSMSKLKFDITLTVNVSDAKKFFKFILTYIPDPNSLSSRDLLVDYIRDDLKWQFLKVELDAIAIDTQLKSKIETKLSNNLSKIGISFTHFEISVSVREKRAKKKEEKNNNEVITGFFDEFNRQIQSKSENTDNVTKEIENEPKSVDQKETIEYTNQNHENTVDNTAEPKYEYCPRCQIRLIKGSQYCHNCGFDIDRR